MLCVPRPEPGASSSRAGRCGSSPASTATARRLVISSAGAFGKSDAVWPSGPIPIRAKASVDALEFGVVLVGGLAGRELAADAVDLGRRARGRRAATRGSAGSSSVRSAGGTHALVDPPQLDPAPVGPQDATRSYARRGLEPPERPIWPPVSTASAIRLRRRLGRRGGVVDDDELDVAQLSPSASSFERSIAAWIAFRNAARTPARSSSRIAWIVVPPGRGHRLAELDRVHVLVAQELRRAEHRLDDELRRDLAGEAEQNAGLDHRLGEQREVRGARAGDGGDGVHVALGHATTRPRCERHSSASARLLLAGVASRADAGDALVDDGGRVRHRAHDRHLRAEVRRSIVAVGIAAATERIVCSGLTASGRSRRAGPRSPAA